MKFYVLLWSEKLIDLLTLAALLAPAACQDPSLRYYNEGLDAFEAGDLQTAIDKFRGKVN